jgi:outer membrane protein assembly factor BamB
MSDRRTTRPAQRAPALSGLLRAGVLLAASSTALAQPGSMYPGEHGPWPGLSGGPTREGMARLPAPPTALRRWTATRDETGTPIAFIPNAGVVTACDDAIGAGTQGGACGSRVELVIALGRVSRPGGPANAPRAFAFDASSGDCRWSAPIAPVLLDSISTPAVDGARGWVLVASGSELAALRLADGSRAWTTVLPRPVVNASPLIVDEGPGTARAFLTDYDGFGADASLHCIRLDDKDSDGQPATPGELLWSAPLGASSGNTPAYLPRAAGGLDLVYVASPVVGGEGPGCVRAFPAFPPHDPHAPHTPPPPAWTFVNVAPWGFFGGVSVRPPDAPGQPPHLFAASYAFFGGLNAANLVKLDGATGSLAWSVPANRTNSMPVLLPGGRVLLSGGIAGFGTVPSLRLYHDLGSSVTTVWDSALDSWIDANQNGLIDPGEYLRVGGWSQQPAAYVFGPDTLAACGVAGTGTSNAAPAALLLLDLHSHPAHPSFVRAAQPGAGAAPAPAGLALFSTGTDGLVCIGITEHALDLDADTRICIDDLYAWEMGQGPRDLDGNGVVDTADRAWLTARVRVGVGPRGVLAP